LPAFRVVQIEFGSVAACLTLDAMWLDIHADPSLIVRHCFAHVEPLPSLGGSKVRICLGFRRFAAMIAP
jgi:hypothetical protein